MGLPYSGPVNIYNNCCPAPGTTPPDIAPYVVSIFGLQGIVGMVGNGALEITTVGNNIVFGFTADAGLGSVTSVGLSSSTLTVGGTPVTTNGTLTVELTGATASIQGLTTAADKMIYTTASNVYAVTDLSSYARTLLDDTTASAARSTLGLSIGLNVQGWSAKLDSFIAQATWTGPDLDLSSALSVSSLAVGGNVTINGTTTFSGSVDLNGNDVTNGTTAVFSGAVQAASFSGNGSSLTALNGTQITTGTVSVARGGTGFAGGYSIGDLIYASGASTFTKLSSTGTGNFLRSTGLLSSPGWSTLVLPNAATTGDLLYGSSSNTIGRLADVATGNALISGGVATAPSWGKITTSHTTGLAESGNNNDIVGFQQDIEFSGAGNFLGVLTVAAELQDGTASPGNSGDVLTSIGSSTLWSNQISIDTLYLATSFSLEGTLTGAGTTGPVTINKPCGTARFAAAGTSLTVTNSLCTTSHRVQATVCTNDGTLKACQAVTTTGAFTLFADAAATAETEVFWELILVG